MNILVTGATGFIGRFLVNRLAANNDRIICLVRQPVERYQKLNKANVELKRADILDKETLVKSIPEVELVYHLAGKVFAKQKRANPYYKVNTEGTKFLAQAMMNSSREYPRFIFLSSIAAVVGKNCGVVEENTLPNPITRYGKSKLEAENILLQYKRQYGLPVTIIRSPLVYVPGDNIFSRSVLLFKMVKRGIRSLGDGNNLLSLCYIQNLIAGLEMLRHIKIVPSDIYFVADEKPRTLNEWAEIIADAEGVSFPKIKIPGLLANILVKFGPHSVRKLINEIRSNWACVISKAREELGYIPPYSSETGIRKTVAWYKSKGII
ncbi:MAG: NAD(P)-dependent oxidoreductase [Candidatus Aerophobus sp.]|nr:MAG: NAD(P)-dependent oxidoreductase [Candidatus Aerophobus sp.]